MEIRASEDLGLDEVLDEGDLASGEAEVLDHHDDVGRDWDREERNVGDELHHVEQVPHLLHGRFTKVK